MKPVQTLHRFHILYIYVCTCFILCTFMFAHVSYLVHLCLHRFNILYIYVCTCFIFVHLCLHRFHTLYIYVCTGFIFCTFMFAQVSYFLHFCSHMFHTLYSYVCTGFIRCTFHAVIQLKYNMEEHRGSVGRGLDSGSKGC